MRDLRKLVSMQTQESSCLHFSTIGMNALVTDDEEDTHGGQELTMRMSPVTICMPPTVPIPPKPKGGPQGGLDSRRVK
jgi:hypothetical protein